jgi:hypothetical protein
VLLSIHFADLGQQSPATEAVGLEKRDARHVVGENEREDVGDAELRALGEGMGEQAPCDPFALVGGRHIDRRLDRPVVSRAAIERAKAQPSRDLAAVRHGDPHRPRRIESREPILPGSDRDRLRVGRGHVPRNRGVIDADNGG